MRRWRPATDSRVAAFGRFAAIVLVVGIAIAGFDRLGELDPGALASSPTVRSLVNVVKWAIGGAVLLVVFARLCDFLFATLDATLDWIHPQLAGPWFRWPGAAVFAACAGCAIVLAAALGSAGVVTIATMLADGVRAALVGDGMIVGALRRIAAAVWALMQPYLGASAYLSGLTDGVVDRWAQPLALLAGFADWYGRRRDDRARIAGIDAVRVAPAATAPPEPALPPSEPSAKKRIILFCDGTSNSANQKDGAVEAPTNVQRLFLAVQRFDAGGLPQIPVYDPGVGTETSRQSLRARQVGRVAEIVGAKKIAEQSATFAKLRAMWELATGAGILENIEQGYREIARLYEPGDEIWLFGFSRGAYTVRCIAGIIDRCGLLRADSLRFVPDVMLLYRRRPLKSAGGIPGRLVRAPLIHAEARVQFMGLWDTVGSLGLPLWGWWFRIGALWRHQALDNNPAAVCEVVCQALSIDETRSQFMPTLAEAPAGGSGQAIFQEWFRGGHAEVGGGYAEHELADIALCWMAGHARRYGLGIDESRLPEPTDANAHAPIRTAVMRNPNWAIFGTWPRWHPADPPESATAATRFGRLHESVWLRARAATPQLPPDLRVPPRAGIDIDARAAADGFVFLAPGASAVVTVVADRVWNRTGVVLERGGIYAIAFESGSWRDRDEVPCGVEGDRLDGLDLARRLFAWARRLPGARYVELVGHVAHPRRWPVFEFGFFKLLLYFALRDPWPLRSALIRLGEPIGRSRRMIVEIAGPSGMFHAFANDLWSTYPNNSGSIRVRIERLDAKPDDDAPRVIVSPRGEVTDVARWGRTSPFRVRVAMAAASFARQLGSTLRVLSRARLRTHARPGEDWLDGLARTAERMAGAPARGRDAHDEFRRSIELQETWSREET